jgi:uracil DNA glycosylase
MRIYVKNNPLVDTLQLLVDLEPSWKKQLYPILNQKTIENLAQFVLQERKRKAVFPPEHLVLLSSSCGAF